MINLNKIQAKQKLNLPLTESEKAYLYIFSKVLNK